ncbi:hypothetical protein EV132_114167 [Rhizobium sullae]|uniref:Uncharacterized protein n=1 Tax=Rhizobium sullae TaxID=50338 RepID=A0A4R3Q534_RHISU|nr:hypothetical protein EV132_114167 [Rhizobium sullae]
MITDPTANCGPFPHIDPKTMTKIVAQRPLERSLYLMAGRDPDVAAGGRGALMHCLDKGAAIKHAEVDPFCSDCRKLLFKTPLELSRSDCWRPAVWGCGL